MENMKIVTINEVDSDSYYWDENEQEMDKMYELKKVWNNLPIERRTGFFTLKKEPFGIEARSVLEDLYEKLADNEVEFEDTYERLEADTTEEYVQELQEVLDKINDFPTAGVYVRNDYINPIVNYKEF